VRTTTRLARRNSRLQVKTKTPPAADAGGFLFWIAAAISAG
jgi:hypothetical protein